MKNRRLSGMTLLELLVVMGLTGVVMLVAWAVLSQVDLSMLEMQKKAERTGEWMYLDEVLRQACAQNDSVGMVGDSVIFWDAEGRRGEVFFGVDGGLAYRGLGIGMDSVHGEGLGIGVDGGQVVVREDVMVVMVYQVE